MSQQCQHCGRTTQLYLCSGCEHDLGGMLRGLVTNRWLEYLEDAALGRTRLGESARRSTEWSRPCPARLTNNEKDSFAGSPSELLNDVHAMLARWVEIINTQVETLGIPGKDTT